MAKEGARTTAEFRAPLLARHRSLLLEHDQSSLADQVAIQRETREVDARCAVTTRVGAVPRRVKIGVLVIASVRRLVLRLPAAFPYRDEWCALALRIGAVPG